MTAFQKSLHDFFQKFGLDPNRFGINNIEEVEDKVAENLLKHLSHRRQFSLRFNALNRKTTAAYREKLRELVGDDVRLTIVHHSHQLSKGLYRNAIAYDTKRSNGVTVVIAESSKLIYPIYGFSICSVRDTYSRVTGLTYAIVDLVDKLEQGNPQVLEVHPMDTLGASRQNPVKYVNQIVNNPTNRISIAKPAKPVVKRDPLETVDEVALTNEVKLAFAEKFGVPIKQVQLKFQHIRYFENKFFGGQLASVELIREYAEGVGKDEDVKMDAFGGFTIAAIELVSGDKPYIFITSSKCLKTDAYRNAFGRITALRNFFKSDLFDEKRTFKANELNPVEGFQLAPGLTDAEKLNNSAIHLLSRHHGLSCNAYIGNPGNDE